MKVRNILKTDDLSIISRVYVESFIDTYKDYIPESFINRLEKEGWLESVENHKDFFVMFSDQDVVGCAEISDGDDGDVSGEIKSIYLLKDYVDQGHGRLLLNAMVKELEERGYSKVFLWVQEDNKRAHKFYEKNGFKRIDAHKNLNLGGQDFIVVKYELDI